MDYCINCGADLLDEMEKCPECGLARLNRRPKSAAPQPADLSVPSTADRFVPDSSISRTVSNFASPQQPVSDIAPAAAVVSSARTDGGLYRNSSARTVAEPVGSIHPSAPAVGTMAADVPLEVKTERQDTDDLARALAAAESLEPASAGEARGSLRSGLDEYGFDHEELEVDPRYAVMGSARYMGSVILMAIPVVGWFVTLIWALGGAKNYNQRNLARGMIFAFLVFTGLLVILFFTGKLFFADTLNALIEPLSIYLDSIRQVFKFGG